MPVLDVEADVRRVVDTLKSGGIAIVPSDTGYGIAASFPDAVERINIAKGRGTHKRNAFLFDCEGERELHRLDARAREMIDAITQDYRLPIGVLAPYDPHHPLMSSMSEHLRKTTTALGKVSTLIGAGTFLETLSQRARQEGLRVIGSSANLTGTGVKFKVSDIQEEIRQVADVIIDYGTSRYHHYGRSSTIIDFETVKVIRYGSCYDMICEVMLRHFGVEFPADPGLEISPSGHVDEFLLADVQET